MINLDAWLCLDKWKTGNLQISGVEVIDNCLKPTTMASCLKTPKKGFKSPQNNKALTPRRKYPNPKYYKECFVNIPNAYCPKCRKYVKETDLGVVCKPCQAYWHYECANTNQDEIDEKWSDIDFLCEIHRETLENDLNVVQKNLAFEDNKLKVRNIKINNYVLNEKDANMTLLKDIDKQSSIEPKDGYRQYTISLSTPTYHLILENMNNLGNQKGMEIKRDDVDLKGTKLKCQWIASIKLNDGTLTNFSITCFHTTNRILIQLTGKNTVSRVNGLKTFVYGTMEPIINTVEATKLFEEVRESMREELSQLICNKISGGEDAQIIAEPESKDIENLISDLVEPEGTKSEGCGPSLAKEDMPDKISGLMSEEMPPHQEKANQAKTTCQLSNETVSTKEGNNEKVLIDKLKISVVDKEKENRRLTKEIKSLNSKIKESEGAEKMRKTLEEKLEKTIKLKDQMTAAVQTLKQENDVLRAQHETYNCTIESHRATLESYATIIKNNDAKLVEKEDLIKEQQARLKETGIGIELHKDIAYRFMDELEGDGEDDDEEEYKKELRKVYAKLKLEEEKNKRLEEELSKSRLKENDDRKFEEESNESTKRLEENNKKITEQVKDLEACKKHNQKEIKQLKDTVSNAEIANSEYKAEIKRLEEELKNQLVAAKVQMITRTDIEQQQRHEETNCTKLQNKVNMLEKELSMLQQVQENSRVEDHCKIQIVEANKLLEDKEKTIDEMKEHSNFVENELKDKQLAVKELEKELHELTQEIKEAKRKYQCSEKEKEEMDTKLTTSRQEISQLLYLNNQLKGRNEKLEQQAEANNNKMKLGPGNVPVLAPIINDEGKVNVHGNDFGMGDQDVTISNLCYNEVRREGSCKFGKPKCRFSHEIPEKVKQNREMVLSIIGQKNLCANQFFNEGSCLKGDNCRFHHVITDEQRNDPLLLESMNRKLRRMRQQRERSEIPMCVYEFSHRGACRRKEECRFDHNISETQRQNQDIKAEINKRLNEIENRRKLNFCQNRETSLENKEESIMVPKSLVEKMYKMLDESPPQYF